VTPVEMELLAGSDEALLATLDAFKARYGIAGTDDDETILGILRGVSARLASDPACAGRSVAGAPALLKGEWTADLSPDAPSRRSLWLPAWPIVEVTEVLEAEDGAFGDATPLVEDEDFQADAAAGRLIRIGGYWLQGERTIRVQWTGGYTGPNEYLGAGYEAEAGEVRLPQDVQDACVQQAGYAWQRRSSLGLSGASAGQGSASWAAEDDLLPGVRETMKAYRRMMI